MALMQTKDESLIYNFLEDLENVTIWLCIFTGQ